MNTLIKAVIIAAGSAIAGILTYKTCLALTSNECKGGPDDHIQLTNKAMARMGAIALRDANPEWKAFDNAFKSVEETNRIKFNNKWNNGTGYMNGCVLDKEVSELPSNQYTSWDPITDRRLLITVKNGKVTVDFERHSFGGGGAVATNQ